jgi:ABC-2 type transport system permease protein
MQWAGQTIWLEAHKQNFALYPWAQDLGLRDGLDEHSLAAWVLIVIPLILALLTYDSIAGEREDGTLRLSVAAGAPPSALIVGKLTAIFLAVSVATIPAGIALALTVEAGPPLIAAVGMYAVYLFQFTALILASSMLLQSRRAALSAALVIWFGNAIAVPGVFAHAAAMVAPEPTSTEIRAAIIEKTHERPTLWDRREEINQRFLRQYNAKSLTDLPVNPDGILLIEQEREDTAATAGNVERVFAAHRRQQEIYGWGSLLSPAIVTGLLSSAVSGTSLWHSQHFAYAAEDYRRKLVGFLNEATAYDASIRTGTVHPMAAALNVQAGRDMWSKAPVFEYQQPTMAASLKPERWRLVAFVSWTAIAVGGLVLASRRAGMAA